MSILLVNETNNVDGEETNNGTEFDFQCWLKTNDLQQIVNIFEKYNMTSLDSINITNINFVQLISDKNIVGNSALITKIISSIQSLQQNHVKYIKHNNNKINMKQLQENRDKLKKKKTKILSIFCNLQLIIKQIETELIKKINVFENILNKITNNINDEYQYEYNNMINNIQNICIDNQLYQHILDNIPKIVSFGCVECVECDEEKENGNKTDNNLIIKKGEKLQLESNKEHVFNSIIIEENGILTVDGYEKGKLSLKILHDLIINKNGMITVNGLGYNGGGCYQSGSSINGRGFYKDTVSNIGGGGGGECGGGGGYGSDGINGKGYNDNIYRLNIDGVGGDIYGSSHILSDDNDDNTFYGSGGGGGGTFSSKGGNGGGIIIIKCYGNVIMNENSIICANGACLSYSAGCGSGGSIYIKCNKLQMDKKAFIHAIGGKHKIKNIHKGHGGNGGDGRIRIQCLMPIFKPNQYNIQPSPYIG